MAFIRQRDNDKYLVRVRVNLGSFFGQADEDVYVVLREVGMREAIKIQEATNLGGLAAVDAFFSMLPDIIEEHNFYETETTLMTNADVSKMLSEKVEVGMKVLEEFKEKLVFTQGKKNEGE